MKRAIAALALSTLFAVPFAAQAQFAKVDDAIEYRRATLLVIGQHFGRVGAVVKGEKPYDKAGVEADVAVLEAMAKLPWQGFMPDSDKGRTKAKPEIWQEKDKFKAAADKMQSEIVKLGAASKTGDLAAIKVAFGATAQTCKACHDNYKSK